MPHSHEKLTGAFRHGSRRPFRSIGRAVGLVMTAALTFTAVGGTAAWTRFSGNVTKVDNSDLEARASKGPTVASDSYANRPVNFVLIGSDSRTGENAAIGGKAGTGDSMRSDTTMLLHISKDRKRVEVISMPRDAMVPIPKCPVTGGGYTSGHTRAQFNTAFADGWDAGHDIASAGTCTELTLRDISQVPMDGFMSVDFAGFEKVVDAIGGIPMCIPTAMKDKKSNLDLQPGYQTLDGEQALALARARHGLADGSDTYRMGRQQDVLAAAAKKVMDAKTLSNPVKVVGILDAVTQSITMSSGVKLQGLLMSLSSLTPSDVTFVTIPSAPDPNNPNRVVLTPEANDVWAAVRNDTPVAAALHQSTSTPSAKSSTSSATPSATPSGSPSTDAPLSERKPGEVTSAESAKTSCG